MKIKSAVVITLLISSSVFRAQIPNYVPLNGLQGYWPFTGNANDLGTNSYNGTVNGATLTTDRFGSANSAYGFNGTSAYISTNYAGILGGNPRAVSFWAKITNQTKAMPAVAWGDNQFAPNAGTRFDCGFSYVNPGATIDGSDAAITYSTNVNHANNVWHHYVFQFSTPVLNQTKVYQDGVLLTQIANSYQPNTVFNTVNNFNVQFGRIVFPPNTYLFEGQLDDIGIWNRVLTNCEIQQLYKSSLNVITAASTSTAVCIGQSTTLNASGGVTYTWSTPSSNPNITVSPTIATTYTVSGTTANGCVGASTITINAFTCAGIQTKTTTDKQLMIYPNPSSGSFSCGGFEVGSLVEIYDALGKMLYHTISNETPIEINLEKTPKGIYFLKVTSKSGTITEKIIKE
jgi:hypothetical protein